MDLPDRGSNPHLFTSPTSYIGRQVWFCFVFLFTPRALVTDLFTDREGNTPFLTVTLPYNLCEEIHLDRGVCFQPGEGPETN